MPISKHFELGAICLKGRFVSFKVGHLFQLGMVFPNLTPNLYISFVSLLFQVAYIFKGSFPL
jgi:hypothetical protein